MAQVNKNTLKEYFETGSIPNQSNFGDLIDSNFNLSDNAPNDINAERKQIDVFLIAGQSNAEGRGLSSGSDALSVANGVLYQYYNGSLTAKTSDPIGGANTGSAWIAFSGTYNALTGRKICLVPSAVGGSAMASGADSGNGNWDTTGSLYATSNTNVTNALSALSLDGWDASFRGILWNQGERDAQAIDSLDITKSDYKNALQTMISNYKGVYGDTMPFYIFKTGTISTGDTTGFQEVRQAQEEVSQADEFTRILFRDAVTFVNRSLMVDTLHYTQAGYNKMGSIGAVNLGASSNSYISGFYNYLNVGGGDTFDYKAAITTDPNTTGNDARNALIIKGGDDNHIKFELQCLGTGGNSYRFFSTGDDNSRGGGHLLIQNVDTGNIFEFRGNGTIVAPLPTSDPSIANALWVDVSDGRTIKSSAG